MEFKGITLTSWWRGELAQPGAFESLRCLRALGADAVAFTPTVYQPTCRGTEIGPTAQTSDPAELVGIIAAARELGMRVLLKPHLDLAADPDHWRGEIGEAFTDAEWERWFASYAPIILAYARLAADTGAELFSVGTELRAASRQEARWRALVAEVRAVYSGWLVYAANHDEVASVAWWDALDLIGVDAYFALGGQPAGSVAELLAAWRANGALEMLSGLAARYGTQVLVTEIGYLDAADANVRPWDWAHQGAPDPALQALCYEAALGTFSAQPWCAGMFWWSWDTDPAKTGPESEGYPPRGKPAEEVLRRWYGG